MIELDRDKLAGLIAMIEDAGQVGYWQFHTADDTFSWSPQVYRIHGRRSRQTDIPRAEALSDLHADDRGLVEDCLLAAALRGEEFQLDARIVRADGSVRYVKMAARPFDGRTGTRDVLGILIDITEFKRTENKLRRLAETDPLTGAVNVRRFEAIATAELRRSARFGKPASLAIIDIDGFKGINDTFGHPVGDEVLRKFVRTMTNTLREVDVVARIGGDEFAILMPETTVDEATRPLERIASLSRTLTMDRDNLTICLTFSAGISAMTPETDLREILRSADTLLYQAKRTGPSRVETLMPEIRQRVS
ncbi:sensor domain-containing diguanylate cyclase [Iodidimonas sp. SYSU 1G8]|uniref:GGDEF domain-containing protein n=1 Tax=Iodidimonas sp. SYSU 1G8 TaxID=3133967 RepID=UPI0031FEA0F9